MKSSDNLGSVGHAFWWLPQGGQGTRTNVERQRGREGHRKEQQGEGVGTGMGIGAGAGEQLSRVRGANWSEGSRYLNVWGLHVESRNDPPGYKAKARRNTHARTYLCMHACMHVFWTSEGGKKRHKRWCQRVRRGCFAKRAMKEKERERERATDASQPSRACGAKDKDSHSFTRTQKISSSTPFVNHADAGDFQNSQKKHPILKRSRHAFGYATLSK